MKSTVLFCVPWILLAVSCREREQIAPVSRLSSAIVARVDNAEISAEVFRAELRRRFPYALGKEISAAQKQAVLEALVRNETLYAQATKAGFDHTPEVEASIKALVVARFKERQFAEPQAVVTDQEIDACYRSQTNRFGRPAAARGGLIFVASPVTAVSERRAAARVQAEAIAAEAKSVADNATFARLAAKYSEDQATRYRGGDTGWVTTESVGFAPELRSALLSLVAPNTFAPLVETDRGFWVVKLVERRESVREPLNQVKEVLRHELTRQKAEQAEREFYARMAQGVPIQIDQALLESISLPKEELSPPRMPGGQTAKLERQAHL